MTPSSRMRPHGGQAAHEQGDIGEELHAMDYLTCAYLSAGGTWTLSASSHGEKPIPKLTVAACSFGRLLSAQTSSP